MNAVLLMTTLALGQPQGYQALKSRTLKVDLEVDAKQLSKVSHVELFVSRDKGGVWEAAAQAKPDAKFLSFVAKDDGLYWLSMVVVYKDGTQDPANVATAPPAQKLLIDTINPVVKFRDAHREGEEIVAEWSIDDAFPADDRTKVEYRLFGGSDVSWKTVPVTSADKRGTKFNPASASGVQVRVTVEDQAGNTATQVTDIGGTNAALKPASTPGLVAPPSMPLVAPIEPGTIAAVPTGPAPVVDLTTKPIATSPPVASPPVLASTTMPTIGSTPPPMDLPQATTINFLKFDLPYALEAGSSGVSRFDLYVTRDDGQTWVKWSEHDGKESPLKVALDKRYNPSPEGLYGFRLLAVSGAGLQDPPPTKGTAPEFRVNVDLTPPIIRIFQPEADAATRDVLTLKWECTDKTLGKDPIALEWSEGPSGPWKPVAGNDGLVPVAAGFGNSTAVRVPNTGSYAWKLPMNLPSHKLYLKITAWDAAGNRSEVATPSPILVDLVKPRAKIQGLVPSK